MCFPFSNSVEKKTLISEYRNNLFLILLIIFVLPGKFEFVWEKLVIFFALLVSNFTFHWLYALTLSRYVILFWEAYLWVGTFLLVTYLIYLKVCFSTIFFFLQSFHCLCNNWIAIYFNYNVCLCYHSIKQCIKTPQI